MKNIIIQMVAQGVLSQDQADAITAAAKADTSDNNYGFDSETNTVVRVETGGVSFREAKRLGKESFESSISTYRDLIKYLQSKSKSLQSLRKDEVQ